MTMRFPLLLASLALAACAQPAPDPSPSATPTERVGPLAPPRDEPGGGQLRDNAVEPAATAALEERYLGRWIGVEGMYLNVTRREEGGVTLDMQWDLDHRGTFAGAVTGGGAALHAQRRRGNRGAWRRRRNRAQVAGGKEGLPDRQDRRGLLPEMIAIGDGTG